MGSASPSAAQWSVLIAQLCSGLCWHFCLTVVCPYPPAVQWVVLSLLLHSGLSLSPNCTVGCAGTSDAHICLCLSPASLSIGSASPSCCTVLYLSSSCTVSSANPPGTQWSELILQLYSGLCCHFCFTVVCPYPPAVQWVVLALLMHTFACACPPASLYIGSASPSCCTVVYTYPPAVQ